MLSSAWPRHHCRPSTRAIDTASAQGRPACERAPTTECSSSSHDGQRQELAQPLDEAVPLQPLGRQEGQGPQAEGDRPMATITEIT
jgi:hypothetical protein